MHGSECFLIKPTIMHTLHMVGRCLFIKSAPLLSTSTRLLIVDFLKM